MAAALTGPHTVPGEPWPTTLSLLLLLFLLPPTQVAATAHRHPASEDVAFSRDVGRAPPKPRLAVVLVVNPVNPGLPTPMGGDPAFRGPFLFPRLPLSLPSLCMWPPWCRCYSHPLSSFLQPVASVLCKGGYWEAWMPLRESGRGRSVCTTQVSTSVVGPSLMSTGSCRLPTALTGEWAVMDTLPMEV